MLNFRDLEAIVGKLGGTMKYFPSDIAARMGVIESIAEMATDLDQVRWLVLWLPKRYREWPGMHEVRALFCSRFKPRDGVEVYSAAYPDGIPSERESAPPALPSASTQIESGSPVTADPELAVVVFNVVQHKRLNIIASTPAETDLLPGESDFSGLLRVIAGQRAARATRGPRAATEEEIVEVKRQQSERAQHDETRVILRGSDNDEQGIDHQEVSSARQ